MRNSRKLYNAYKKALSDVQSIDARNNNGDNKTFQYVAHKAHNARMAYMKLDNDGSYFEKNGYRKDILDRNKNRYAILHMSDGNKCELQASSTFGLDRAIRAYLDNNGYTNVVLSIRYIHAGWTSVCYSYDVMIG